MSTGFPHDPFHQIVNVHWGERIAFRFGIQGIGNVENSPGFPFFCDPAVVESPPADFRTTFSVRAFLTSNFTAGGETAIQEVQQWDGAEQEWDEVEEDDYEFTNMPANHYLDKTDFANWEWHAFDPELAVPDTPNAVDWDPLTGRQLDIRVPEYNEPPFLIDNLFFQEGTSFTLFGRGVELDQNPVCYGSPLGGSGQQAALTLGLGFQRIPGFQVTVDLRDVRITKQSKVWKPYARQMFRAHSKGTMIFVYVLCRRTAAT